MSEPGVSTLDRVARSRDRSRPMVGAVAALIVLVIANALFTPNFASPNTLWNVLWQVSTVAIVGIGMTFVIATGGIDLSVGSVMAIGGAIAAVQLEHGVIVALVSAVAGSAIVGLLNGALISRRGNQPIVVTLATLIAGRGLAQVLSRDGELISIDNPAFTVIGRGRLGVIPVPVIVAFVGVLIAAFVLRRMAFGRYILAVGGNPRAARLAGVPVRKTLIAVYVLSAVLAAVAGILETARIGASDAAKVGLNVELDAIAAVVIGGTILRGGRATMLGTLIGALVMQVIATSFNMLLVPYAWSVVCKAAILVVAVYLQRPSRA